MFIKLIIIIITISFNIFISAKEFIYPVFSHENNIYYIHQKKIDALEVLTFDTIKKSLNKENINGCLPGNLNLLPDKNGFSFIDQGKIRIKYFNIEKIQTINLQEPIYNISNVEWIDNENFYFSGKNSKRFDIYFSNILQNNLFTISCETITDKICSDLLYPQRINSDLYFIERSVDERYKTKKSNYKIVKIKCPDYSISGFQFLPENENSCIINLGNMPISFLKMINENEGYFLEHPTLVDKTDKIISLTYHKLYFCKDDNKFKNIELFSFNLPINYIFGSNSERLYESILPFLPKQFNNEIFFSHCLNDLKLLVNIYSYNLDNQIIAQKTFSLNTEMQFSPIMANDNIYCGSNIIDLVFIPI